MRVRASASFGIKRQQTTLLGHLARASTRDDDEEKKPFNNINDIRKTVYYAQVDSPKHAHPPPPLLLCCGYSKFDFYML